jgi:hypothetical protein
MSQEQITELQTDLQDKCDKARYHNHFLLPKDQPEYFEQAARVVEEFLSSLHDACVSQDDHDKEIDNIEEKHEAQIKVMENAHQFAYNEIVVLIEDLGDKKLTFTRPALQTRLNALLKKMKANIHDKT